MDEELGCCGREDTLLRGKGLGACPDDLQCLANTAGAKELCQTLLEQCFSVRLTIDLIELICIKLSLPSREFIEDYEKGLTPNPDVLCNKFIKFNHFFLFATEDLGADAIATGHYANSSFGPYLQSFDGEKCAKLLKPKDTFKDQTFFLSQISQEALRRTMFPLAGMVKRDVKKLASEIGLDFLAQKKESTGICFIGKRHFPDFISEYVSDNFGDFVDTDNGEVVGRHRGLHHWTVGQGCRLGGHPMPYFVAEKEVKTNRIYVASGTNHPALYSTELMTDCPHWIAGQADIQDVEEFQADFRFQHTKPLVPCRVAARGSDGGLCIRLERPLRAVTPGQYAVLYVNDECLGSARIVSRRLMQDHVPLEGIESVGRM